MTQQDLFGAIKTGASFSDCRSYRYTLWRSWDVGPLCNFLMLNPSTADDVTNDPTVERCQRRAMRLGFGGLIVTNLFAFRATDPKEMKSAVDPVGDRNDDAIIESASQASMVICAWGVDGAFRDRDKYVRALLQSICPTKVHALKVLGNGQPGHPLYLPYSLQPTPWQFATP